MAFRRSYMSLDRDCPFNDLKCQMSPLKHLFRIAFVAVFADAAMTGAVAQRRVNPNEYPFSIMNPEPGERRARPQKREQPPAKLRPAREAKQDVPRRIRRGSSSPSPLPAYQSPLTPLGTAPRIGNVPTLAQPSSPPAPVPGVTTSTGATAVTPQRPAGQSFPDRAVNCVHSGTASGVSPGQIGAFTQSCVNR